jgi:glycosyltransferase involved in cell wall biosynthesis
MRVLVVDEEIPYPTNSGKRLRTFNLIKHLASRHEIVWIYRGLHNVHSDPRGLEELGIQCIKIPHPVPQKHGLRFCAALLGNLISRYPYVVTSHRSKPLIKEVGNTLSRRAFDLIHCEWAPYAINLEPFKAVPKIVIAHNVESKVWERLWELESNSLRKAFIYRQWKKMARFEAEFLPSFSRVVAVSETDASLLGRWVSREQLAVVPNGVDSAYFHPSESPEMPESLIFTGSLDWRANVDCILYFLDEIWPDIRATFPNTTFTVVGRNPSAELIRRIENTASVSLKASVDDIRPYLRQAAVCIVPLRIGSGSRLKILEALAMGKAVVSSSIGAEGLELEPGKHLILADTPKDFLAAVSRLFRDADLCRKLGKAGRSLVESRYRWEDLAGCLEAIWIDAARGRCRRN